MQTSLDSNVRLSSIPLALIIVLLFSTAQLSAQQWIEKKYAVDTTLNLIYGTALNFNNELDTLRLDLYLPQCEDALQQTRRPLLVWIHGGAFLAGTKEDVSIANFCRQFARRGYVCASLNYRLGFISDTLNWQCNYPNYPCVFAQDTAEWIRAWYRGVQDAKGALRFLIHRATQYRIDPDNVFLAGESAGSFVALGAALLDSAQERPLQSYALNAISLPAKSTRSCIYNATKHFGTDPIVRPDLGPLEGGIELDNVDYTIKAVANNYGGLVVDLLRVYNTQKPKPAIYNFHQPCDIVVPIDSGVVYQGLSWCMTNGYGCYGIAHTPKVYGSRIISRWNTQRNYGYEMHDEFTPVEFPYSFVFGDGSCTDQVNKPCHAFDNISLRENNIAAYFAPRVSTQKICDTTLASSVHNTPESHAFQLSPQPASDELVIRCGSTVPTKVELYSLCAEQLHCPIVQSSSTLRLGLSDLPAGCYCVVLRDENTILLRRYFLHR